MSVSVPAWRYLVDQVVKAVSPYCRRPHFVVPYDTPEETVVKLYSNPNPRAP